MNAVLGYSGFVGSHLLDHVTKADLYNSKNIHEIHNKNYDTIYCACVPAYKWKANQNPEEDKKIIEEIKNHIDKISSCGEFVLISTIDVHDSKFSLQTEDVFKSSSEPYGKHRYEFEEWVKGRFENVYIIRLPALFGLGLKKNALYDMLNNRRLEYIHLEDQFQWYDLQWLYYDIQKVLELGIKSINLYSKPIKMKNVISYCFPHLLPLFQESSPNREPITYNQCTKYEWASRKEKEVLEAMLKFIKVHQVCKDDLMVSSLHWNPSDLQSVSKILKHYGIKKVELLPGFYLDWNKETLLDDAREIKFKFEELGLSISSIQGILYGLDNTINDENSQKIILDRFHLASKVAKELGAKTMVFGSPKNRSKGELDDIIKICQNYVGETILCIENVSKKYGCSVGCNLEDVSKAVRMVDKYNVGINADIGNAFMEDDISFFWDDEKIKHKQISMPNLESIDKDTLKDMFKRYGAPNGSVSLEIRSEINNLAKNLYEFLYEYSQNLEDKKVLIIGAGWYGCYSAFILEKLNIPFKIYDRAGIFTGSSFYNQNRLHQGFHYPRSSSTRKECISGYFEFKENFSKLSHSIKNYYIISKKSIIDFETYTYVFKDYKEHPQTNWSIINNIEPFSLNYSEIDGQIISVNEEFIDPITTQNYFREKLGKYLIDKDESANQNFTHVLDCTFGNLLENEDFIYELCVTFVLKQKKEFESVGLTVMDGLFFSIYPYDLNKGLYTLTHVKYTPYKISDKPFESNVKISEEELEIIRNEMEKEARKYLKNYDDMFEVVTHFISSKTKTIDNNKHDRSIRLNNYGKTTSIIGGKITGVFKIKDFIFNLFS